jgi:ankyrin repeat protein
MIPENVNVPQRLEALRIGSAFDIGGHEMSPDSEFHQTILHAQAQAALTTVEDLIQMHINKQKDDNTTRFLFAASRSDLPTLRLMLNSGLDPNSADYDRRNALMVAAMNGNSEVVTLLLDYHANPNLVDVHGTSALYEAVKGAHDDTIDILLKHGGTLCMPEETAATTLCQCVFNGDLLFLKRLCKAGIDINAGDYDRRRAVHIAASEGNLAAVRVLAECGADLTVLDRWDNSIEDEAKRANAVRLLVYLESLKTSKSS